MIESETASRRSIDHILVVDDEDDTRRALERSLRRLGYEVSDAANGEEGLRLAIELQPQVVLADIRMPTMDGHTLLRRLAAHDLDAAVIVMSAHGNMDDVIDVLRNGAVDYLRKPWAPSELVASVGRAVTIHDHRQLARRLKAAAESTGAGAGALGSAGCGGPTGAMGAVDSPARAPEAAPSPILQQIRRGEMVLPPMPAELTQLRMVLAKPDASMDEIALLVERDGRLAADVLRVTNSAQYRRRGRIDDIRAAVSRIGLRQLQNIVQTVILRDTHETKDRTLRAVQMRVWRYSIARAISMRGLGELFGAAASVDPERAYLAGLYADVGASFFLGALAENPPPESSPKTSPPYAGMLRREHEEIGALVLARWGVDAEIIHMARTHHFDAPPVPPNRCWNMAILGAAIADKLTGGDDPTRTGVPSPELIDRCAADLRIGATTASKIEDSVRREFVGVMEALA
ncbi:MAG: HDOD domain-containing protein [Myxococcota bacterium]